MKHDDDDEDEELTPIVCAHCGARFTFGAGRTATECPVCRGRVHNSSQWRLTVERAMTADGLVTLVADLRNRLRRSRSPRAEAMIAEADGFLRVFGVWKKSPPSQADRSKLVTAVADWHARAWVALEDKDRRVK